MRQVFISYSRKDEAFVEQLASDLAAHLPNVKVFYDKLLPPGKSFADTLEAKIEQADVVLAILSPDYLESSWTKQELNVALDRQLKKQACLLPLMVRPCTPTGFVAQLTWVDFTVEYEHALARLIGGITGEPIIPRNHELEAEVVALKLQLAAANGKYGPSSSPLTRDPGNLTQGTPTPQPLEKTLREWIKSILDVKLAFSLFALIVALGAMALGVVAFNRADVELNFNKEGATVVTRRNEVTKAMVLLPANRLWLNTGLELKKGQSVTITASGSINLAIHRLVETAKDHKKRPRLGWIGPDGGKSYKTDLDNARSKYLISPDPDHYGALLACIVSADDRPLGKDNPYPKGIKQIGSRGSITAESAGTLWLVVNDVVLTEQSRDAYVASQKILDEVYGVGIVTVAQREREWEEIKNRRYYEAFFDDNVGEFLIHVDFTK